MFDIPGVWLCWPNVLFRPGSVVAVLMKHFGFWSLNCWRIVYVIDEGGHVRRYGFAYGTRPEHAEQGEERFTVEWDRTSDLVAYDILSFSRPGSLQTRAALPSSALASRTNTATPPAIVSGACFFGVSQRSREKGIERNGNE